MRGTIDWSLLSPLIENSTKLTPNKNGPVLLDRAVFLFVSGPAGPPGAQAWAGATFFSAINSPSSPASYISIMISLPPTNSPLT